jgi:hypothetical protein
MKDHKDLQPATETKTFFEMLETATPVQVAQSVIAQVMKKLSESKQQKA